MHARTAAELGEGLRALPASPDSVTAWHRVPGGTSLTAEHERLCTAVHRATRELAELAAALLAAANAADAADLEAARDLGRVEQP